jgi:hypothetical protein
MQAVVLLAFWLVSLCAGSVQGQVQVRWNAYLYAGLEDLHLSKLEAYLCDILREH